MKTVKEIKEMGYPELQKYAAVLETELGMNIDRSAKKVELQKAVIDALAKAPKTEEPPATEEKTEEKAVDEVPEEKPELNIKKKAKWVAIKAYKDWESGIEFDPNNPEKNEPFEIKNMTSGLKNAMAKGIVVRAK